MSKFLRSRILQSAVVCCLTIIMLGADDVDKRYERIGHNMMCACSCGQILLECNHMSCPDSGPMGIELKQQIAAGGSDKDILNWFVNKYGATILAAPLRGGFDNVAWIMPIALFLAAILGTAAIIRVWKSRTRQRAPLKIKGMSVASTEELRERIRRETLY